GDATAAPVTPAGGGATTLGAYLGLLAKSSDLTAYLTTTAAGQIYATQAALTATTTTANAAIPASKIGQVSGVAGLDASGHLTAPLTGDATAAPVTPAGGSATTLGAYLGTLARSSDLSAYLTTTAASQTYAMQAALTATTTTANAAIPTSKIGAASGVAGLDASGRVTAPIASDLTPAVVTPTGGTQVHIADALAAYATQAGLTSEITRATGVEVTLQSNIAAEATTRANADALQMPINGGSFNGAVNIPSSLAVTSPDGVVRDIAFTNNTNGTLPFWAFRARGAITSANAGVPFVLAAFDDSGHILGIVFSVERATQIMTLSQSPVIPTPPAGDNSARATTTAGVRREIATGYTVATLPTDARRYQGARAYVTDATACAFATTPTGGGSTFCPVIYNGTAWIAE
ncbi:hypothetical protein, partial [Gluconacetobacter sacchari]